MVWSTNLTSHHHHIFVGDVESGRPQTVPIQDSSNISGTKKAITILCPKSKHFFARATKFLFTVHQRMWSTLVRPKAPSCSWPICSRRNIFALLFHIKTLWIQVPPVEVLLLLRHCRVVLPGFRNYRHHRLGQWPVSIQSFFARLEKRSANLPPACIRNSIEQSMLPESERSFSTTG